MEGVWGSPHTPLKVAELAASCTLGLEIKHKAQAQQRAAQKQPQQIIRSHQFPNGTDQLTKRTNVLQNVGHTDSNSFLKYPSFLKNYGCGSWIRTNNARFRAW